MRNNASSNLLDAIPGPSTPYHTKAFGAFTVAILAGILACFVLALGFFGSGSGLEAVAFVVSLLAALISIVSTFCGMYWGIRAVGDQNTPTLPSYIALAINLFLGIAIVAWLIALYSLINTPMRIWG